MIIGFVILLCIVIAGLQNGLPLQFKFLLWDLQTTVTAMLFWAAVAGALVVAVISLPKLAAKSMESRRLHKEVDRLEKLCMEGTKARTMVREKSKPTDAPM